MKTSAPIGPIHDGSTDKLVQRLRPVIERRVRLRLQHHSFKARIRNEDVEDLIQDVFVALLAHDRRALTMHDPRRMSLSAWVCLIVDRVICSILRSARKNPCFLEPVDAQTLEAYLDPVEHNAFIDDSQYARVVWLQAGPRTREVLEGLLGGYEINELPALTGMSPDAVHQACTRLRKLSTTIGDTMTVL